MPYFGVPIRNGLPIGLGTLTALAQAVAVVVPPVSSDPYFEYVSLLANTTSTNGAQNNTFLDGSTNAFSITRNGNTTQGTFSPFSQTGWSNYFDGTGDYLSVASNAAFDLGSSDFTIEAWVNPSSFTNGYAVASRYNFSGSASGWVLRFVNATTLRFIRGNDVILDATISASVGVWYHVAAVRNGSTLTVYLNGVQVSQATGIANFTDATTALQIGRTNTATDDANGYTSNLRIVKGIAVYTSNFTPPTAPLPLILDTSLLTCQSNRFIDNSLYEFPITRNGDVSVQAFSPFNPTAAWSASTNGGSGYFDGTGDFVTVPLNTALDPGTGAFTFECWFYAAAAVSNSSIFEGINNGLSVTFNLGKVAVAQSNVAYLITDPSNFPLNQWVHVAASRSGTTLSLFVNGTRVGTATNSTNFVSSTENRIGRDATTNYITGYLSNLRLVKGTAVYDPTLTTLTVPTAPLTAITNTSLLLNFTNAGIFDAAGANNFETVGNAQVSTTQAKYGTTSMAFDGTADRLVMPARPPLAVGSGNFTIEGWVYRLDTNTRGVFQLSGTAGGLQANTTTNLALGSDAGQVWRIYANNSAYNSTATWAINTWYHFALVRSSGVTTLYINGISVITQADTVNYTGQNLCIGGFYDTTFLMNGYIDDLRITNGYARYTANFTPPTAAFPLN